MTLKIRMECNLDLDLDLDFLLQKFIRDSWDDKIIICNESDKDYDLVVCVKKSGSFRHQTQQKYNKPVMDLILRNVVVDNNNPLDKTTTYLLYTQNSNALISWIGGKYKPTSPESYKQSCKHLKAFFIKNYQSKQSSPRDGVGGQVSFVVGMVAAVVLMAVSTIVDQ
jgi:hypothetical protein